MKKSQKGKSSIEYAATVATVVTMFFAASSYFFETGSLNMFNKFSKMVVVKQK